MKIDPNAHLITGEIDQEELANGGDGIVYADSQAEAERIREELKARGLKLHGIEEA